MATGTQKIGNFDLTLEQRGVRIARSGKTNVSVRPLLSFYLTEAGQQRSPFSLTSIMAVEGGVEVMGHCTEHVSISVVLRPLADQEALTATLKVINASRAFQLRVTMEMTLTGEAEPRWMIPGFFYSENRPEGANRLYPAFSEVNRDPRRFVSNHWAFRSDRAATPVVCAWTYGCFAWVGTEGQFGRSEEMPDGVGLSGLRFHCQDGQPVLGADFPYQEAPVKYSFCHEDKHEPEEVFVFLPENTPMTVTVMVGLGEPLMDAYAGVIRGWYQHFRDVHPASSYIPTDYAESVAHMGLLRWHYDSQQGAIYETTAFEHQQGRRRGDRDPAIMHVGCMGGAVAAYALLKAGRDTNHTESVTAAVAVLNRMTAQLAPAGTIFPAWAEETGWACSYGPEDGTGHSRTIAEAIVFLLRGLALELRHNVNHSKWLEAAQHSLNYAVGAQREDGAFPTYFDLATGRPTNYEGTGGLAWVAAMALGATILNKPHFLEVAVRGAEYYSRLVTSHDLWGAAEDEFCVPTSDDAHWALISYMAVYEADRDVKWLGMAKRAADLALSWRFTHNVAFGMHTMLGRYGMRTVGGDAKSVATPILGATGLVSYLELRKLGAFLGDPYYQQRADEARAFATQLVALDEGHWNARVGMTLGHVHHTDYVQPKGTIDSVSMSLSAALIKYAELYARNLDLGKALLAPVTAQELQKVYEKGPRSYADFALEGSAPSGLGIGLLSQGRQSQIPPDEAPSSMGIAGLLGLGGGAGTNQRVSRTSGEVNVGRVFPSGTDNPVAAMLGISDSSPRRTPIPQRNPAGPRPPDQPIPPASSPQPFPGGVPNIPSVDDGGDEVEIKYKIF